MVDSNLRDDEAGLIATNQPAADFDCAHGKTPRGTTFKDGQNPTRRTVPTATGRHCRIYQSRAT
jgi:hypothetical protein